MAETTVAKVDFHNECLMVGETLWRRHLTNDDGEKCFNLFAFLEDLENELDVKFDAPDRLHRFNLNSSAVARYLWCHMSLNSGDAPDGTTFRGHPILG